MAKKTSAKKNDKVREEMKAQLRIVTPENAEEKIGSKFQEKMERVKKHSKMFQGLTKLWNALSDHGFSRKQKLAALGAIIYFILPFDFIGDWIPWLGLVDDAAVVAAALAYIGKDDRCAAASPERILDEAESIVDTYNGEEEKDEPEEEEEPRKPLSRTVARLRREAAEEDEG